MKELERMIKRMPKAELHLHLDGALRLGTLKQFIDEKGVDGEFESLYGANVTALAKEITGYPTRSYMNFAQLWGLRDLVKFPKGNLDQCLTRFGLTLSVLQNGFNLNQVGYEIVQDLWNDGVTYGEIRFCPLLHTREGLSGQEAFDAVYEGVSWAQKKYPVDVNFIFCAIRNINEAHGLEVVELAQANKGKRVVGIDLAGGEEGNPPEKFKETFKAARRIGLKRTVHAGEVSTTEQAVKNIDSAIEDLQANRISHATSIIYNEHLVRKVLERGITLEFCPTSNIFTGTLNGYGDMIPIIKTCLDKGIKCCLGSDDPLFCVNDTSMEYVELSKDGLSLGEIAQMNEYAFDGAFRKF